MSKTWKNVLLIGSISLACIIGIFFIVMGVSGIYTHNKGDALETDDIITEEQLAPVDKASGKINILLLGVDVDGLRTDTIIVASYDLDEGKINLLSIPRDTRMYIGSRYQKINAAHALSQKGGIKGPQGSIEAVTRLTGIPINYYIEFNFSTFRDVIDALGGIEFDVPRDMDYEDPYQDLYIHLKKGQQHLDGDKAEQLVRFRRYPEGDIARVQMQQNFIRALAEQKLNLSIIESIPDLYNTFKENITTNFTIVDIMKYLPNVKDLTADDIVMYQVPGNYNDVDYGASYWICDMDKLKTIVRETFEYPADKATIHSADGTSKSKDTKNSSKTSATSAPVSGRDEPIIVTPKPSKTTGNPTKAPSVTSKPSSSPDTDDTDDNKKSTSPRPTTAASGKPTSKPTATVKPTSSSDDKPEATPKPTAADKPVATPKPATPAPAKTAAPSTTGNGEIKRPAANPEVSNNEE